MDRPHALELLKGHKSAINRSGPVFPEQRSVSRPQAVDRTVCGSQYEAAFPVRGGGIDASPRRKTLALLPRIRSQRMQGMLVNLRDVDLVSDNRECAETPPQLYSPFFFQGAANFLV